MFKRIRWQFENLFPLRVECDTLCQTIIEMCAMVKKDQFKAAAKLAATNIIKHGDTDIFPYPFDRHAYFDKLDDLVDLISEYDEKFDDYITRYSPQHTSALTPVTYSGFRWATQLDPIWNVHFLACVLALAKKFESVRIPKSDDVVFSYRYSPDKKSGDLFDRKYGWFQFMSRSLELSNEYAYVVSCDISEFYPRLGHHRVENALKQIAGDVIYCKRIMDFLSHYSNSRSFGLPIGGPAARILSEITINQIDRLLLGGGIVFTRFADDYHLFAHTREDAYRNLIFLSEKLFINQGLSLQKSKTRIMSAAEFRATNPILENGPEADPEDGAHATEAKEHSRHRLMRFSLRFDPYSPTAEEDYETLKQEIRKFDIVNLLKEELSKSRVHTALAKKIISAIKFLDGQSKDDAVLSLLDNADVLYPIFSAVLMTISEVFDDITEETQNKIIESLHKLINDQSHIMRVDVHLAFAIRVLSHKNTMPNHALLQQLYETRTSPIIRRDIILIMAKWGEWYWLSDIRNRFRELTGQERRAFIVASYKLSDEGEHWRKAIRSEFNPYENFVLSWAGERSNNKSWDVPL